MQKRDALVHYLSSVSELYSSCDFFVCRDLLRVLHKSFRAYADTVYASFAVRVTFFGGIAARLATAPRIVDVYDASTIRTLPLRPHL
jgi:hypothetical protein